MIDTVLSINIGFSFVIWFIYLSMFIATLISKIELKEDFQNFIYSKLPLLSVVFLYLTNLAFEKSYGFFWFSLLKYLIISFTL
ncbi:MAG: hypothetical protein ACP5KI_04680, partial [Brevinematia bacterium]